jgi:serine/threonine protein kinase
MSVKHLDEEALFHAARRITTEGERELFIRQACGDNAGLAQRVRALLEMHAQDVSGADAPPRQTADYPPIAERAGSRIGPYRLMEKIGEGGFGLVFVAEQTEPVKRKVALKIIKPGMDSAQVIARFEAERQALALMDHPNIARVLDAGTTESGRPYFVMELVRGIPITDYCDQNQLTPRERLELFVSVCNAIQHAHHKGIIHRDVKPSNVLVTSHDGKPMAKVIDFGVAKAIHQHLTEKTIYTNFAQMIGTPLYMSPEQAEMSGLDIDTRSDIYSLGVLLYELLTGSTPLEKQRLAQAAYDEIRRVIREEEPPRPSQRLSTSDTLPSLAANRKTEPARLSRMLRGEIDWIVMKALEKDRTRRYETANGFAMDVQRYLGGEPVLAVPPSAGYRLRKFARKHRAALTTGAAFLFILMCAVAFSTYQAMRALISERRAQEAMVEAVAAQQAQAELAEAERRAKQQAEAAAAAEKQAKEAAEAHVAETKAVLDFLQNDVLSTARPQGQEGGHGRDVTVRRAIEAAMPALEKSFKDQPLIEARLRMTIGSSFAYLGESKLAAEQYEAARARYTRHHGPDHPDTLASTAGLAESYQAAGRTQEALKLREETLQLRKAKLGSDHPDTLRSMYDLAMSYFFAGRSQEALKLSEETLLLRKAKLGPDHPDTLRSMHSLAISYATSGRTQEALKLREETLPLMKAKLGPDHPDTLTSMLGLANSYAGAGRSQEAFKHFVEFLPLMKAKLGPDHPNTLLSMHFLAMAYARAGRTQEALKLSEETLQLRKAKLGPDHPDTLWSTNELAWLLATATDVKLRDPQRAVDLAAIAAEKSPKDANYRGTLGTARYRTGDWKGATADLEKALSLRKADDAMNANEGFFLAMAHWQLGEKDRARAWFDKSVAWMETGRKDDAELKRFRAEAAKLLGVDDEKK